MVRSAACRPFVCQRNPILYMHALAHPGIVLILHRASKMLRYGSSSRGRLVKEWLGVAGQWHTELPTPEHLVKGSCSWDTQSGTCETHRFSLWASLSQTVIAGKRSPLRARCTRTADSNSPDEERADMRMPPCELQPGSTQLEAS